MELLTSQSWQCPTLLRTSNGRCQIKHIILQSVSKLFTKTARRATKTGRGEKKGHEEVIVILCPLKCHLDERKGIRVMRDKKNTVKK